MRGIAVAVFATLATHPFAWWGIVAAESAMGYWAAVLSAEALVCLAEAIAYRFVVPLGWPTALGVSVAANAASTLAGLIYYAVAW